MGSSWSSVIDRFYCRRPYRIVVLGLDATGKTSLLYRLKKNGLVQTIPTIGFNVEIIHLKYCKAIMWDVGGGDKIPPLWRHYYDGSNGIVYMVDATDKERLDQSAENFHYLLRSTSNIQHTVLILANKMDLDNCMTEEEILEKFALQNRKDVTWRIQPASIRDWRGVEEGLEWLSKEIRK